MKFNSSLTPLVPLFLLLLICLLSPSARADRYVLDESATWPSGNTGSQPLKEPEDKEVCALYLENLRYFARRNTPMSCERPIAVHLQNRIQKVEWEDLNPDQHAVLFKAILAKRGHWDFKPPSDAAKAIAWIINQVRERRYAFRRALFSLRAYPPYSRVDEPRPPEQPVWLVQFGPYTADPKNSDPTWRCVNRRGGPRQEIWSDLELYVVSEDLKNLFGSLANKRGQRRFVL